MYHCMHASDEMLMLPEFSKTACMKWSECHHACVHTCTGSREVADSRCDDCVTAVRQGDLLHKLRGTPHLVNLVAHWVCMVDGATWNAILLQPQVEHLAATDGLQLVAQVGDTACVVAPLACQHSSPVNRPRSWAVDGWAAKP